MATSAKSEDGFGHESARKAYILPNNRQEIERMKNQHEWIKGSFGGLVKAPIDYQKKNQKILDSAAADGIIIHCSYNSFALLILFKVPGYATSAHYSRQRQSW
jgi:hypothetical protein